MVIREKGLFLYQAAGRLWPISLTVLSPKQRQGGDLSDDPQRVALINRSIANAICGSAEALTGEQLKFLCQVTGSKNTQVANHLAVNRSNITVWIKRACALPTRESAALKKWFWHKLFGDVLGDEVGPLPSRLFFDDAAMRQFLEQSALASGRAFALHEEELPAQRAQQAKAAANRQKQNASASR